MVRGPLDSQEGPPTFKNGSQFWKKNFNQEIVDTVNDVLRSCGVEGWRRRLVPDLLQLHSE